MYFKKTAIIVLTMFLELFFSNSLYCNNIDSIKVLINSTNDKHALISLYENLSKAYININDTNAIHIAKRQLQLSEELNSTIDIANSYRSMALSYKMYGDNYLALNNFFKEMDLRNNINDKYGKCVLLANIGETYRGIFEHQKGIDYLNSALELARSLNYTYGMAYSLNRLASIYFELNDSLNFEKAIKLAKESNAYASEINNTNIISLNYLVIGGSVSFFKKYDESLKYFFTSLKYNQISEEKIHKSLILKSIAVVYYFKKDYKTAISYADTAMKEADKYNVLVYQWLAADLIYKTYQIMSRYDSAFKYLDYSTAIKSKMYVKEKEYALYRAEAKHQKLEFEQAELANQEKDLMIAIIFLISIISILTILALIIFRNKKLKKINKQLSDKNSIIELQKDELSALNSTKDKFFSIIAHDLKNPLGSFKSITSSLRKSFFEFTEDEKIEFLDLMSDSAENLYILLLNLLEWARTQSGKITYNPTESDLFTMVSNNITSVKSLANHKKIRIFNNVQKNTIVKADPNMLNTIVRNLLTNAIKFSNEAANVAVSTIDNNGSVILKVEDTGIGISKEKIDKLFRIDTQVSTLGTMNEKGSGLGLILCKEFIEFHGGSITVESEVGKGSTFCCEIPKN